MGRREQRIEIVRGVPKRGSITAIIGHVIAEVGHRRGKIGEIQIASMPSSLSVVEPAARSPLQVADPVAVRILEGARIDLIDDRGFPPVRVVMPRLPCTPDSFRGPSPQRRRSGASNPALSSGRPWIPAFAGLTVRLVAGTAPSDIRVIRQARSASPAGDDIMVAAIRHAGGEHHRASADTSGARSGSVSAGSASSSGARPPAAGSSRDRP